MTGGAVRLFPISGAMWPRRCMERIRLRGLTAASWRFMYPGGTTDALLVEPDGDTVLRCETVATSLDLKAGQLIDRVGRMLACRSRPGRPLERLALGGSGGLSAPALAGGWQLPSVRGGKSVP